MILKGFSPYRLSFFGGGTDIEPYPSEYGGCCISHTIAQGCYGEIDFSSKKKQISDMSSDNNCVHNGLKKILSHQYKNFSFSYYNDLPTGSGLGTSGSLIGMLAAFENFKNFKKIQKLKTANRAYFLEKKLLKTFGGRQDEFASIYGGFNFMEFNKDKTSIQKINVSTKFKIELQEKSLLMFTGMTRDGSKIIENHINIFKKKKNIKYLHEIKKLTISMKEELKRNNIKSFLKNINLYWNLKKKYNPQVSNKKIDNMIKVALDNGATSCKLTGAGNGGHLLIFVSLKKRLKIIKKLEKLGCSQINFSYSNLKTTVYKGKKQIL